MFNFIVNYVLIGLVAWLVVAALTVYVLRGIFTITELLETYVKVYKAHPIQESLKWVLWCAIWPVMLIFTLIGLSNLHEYRKSLKV